MKRMIVGLLLVLATIGCTQYEIRGARLYEIERAIEVAEGENKFVIINRGFFGGAGAGGIGAPQIRAMSAVQFAELVPEDEPIYTWWELPRRGNVKQVYWAFIENRAGLMIWETVYRPGRYSTSCDFEYMTDTELVFSTGGSGYCGPTKWYDAPGWTKVGEWKSNGS